MVSHWRWEDQYQVVTVSTCSDLTLMELGAIAEKDIWMLSPCLSMSALCSISSTWLVPNNSVANKGCRIHTFCLLVLTRMTGTLLAFVVAMHLLITMPGGRLWCWACSTRQVNFDGILLVCPRHSKSWIARNMYRTLFRANCDLSNGSILPLKIWSVFFLDRSSVFGDLLISMFWDMTSEVAPNVLVFCTLEWWKKHNWENNKRIDSFRTYKWVKSCGPIFLYEHVIGQPD